MVSGDTDVPVELTREEAQRLAERELSHPRYQTGEPSLLGRAVQWVLDQLGELLAQAGAMSPGGYQGLLLLGFLALLAVIAIRLGIGRIGQVATRDRVAFESRPRTAAQYRQAADEYAARGEWAAAVRERLRAIVRHLEERDLVDSRPGRTAREAATEAGRILPQCADGLVDAARIFDDVWYGARPATREMDARLREVDEATRRASPVLAVPAP